MRLPDTEIFHRMPFGSDTAIVSFGAKGGGHGHFHFFKLLRPLPGFTKLLVRDPSGSWYQSGLPGVGETLAEVTVAIEAELAELGASRVVTSGSSMGGYAAILFGCMLGAERAIPLAPQTLLDRSLRYAPPAGVPLQAPDLKPVIAAAPGTRIDLVAGWDDPLDIFNAERVAELPSVRVLALHGGTHGFVEDLHRDDRLLPLFDDLIAGRVPQGCEADPDLDPDLVRRLTDVAYATGSGDWSTVVERVGPVAEGHPDWAGPNFELGRALAKTGDWAGAEEPLRRALRSNPYWAGAHLSLSECLRKLGRVEEGRASALRAAELDPRLASP